MEYCDMHFVMGMHVVLLTNTKGVFPTAGFHLGVYFLVFMRQCVRLVVFCVLLWSEREVVPSINTRENILEMVQRSPHLYTCRMASRIGVSHEEDLHPYRDHRVQHQEPGAPARHTHFCHWISADPQMLSVILFTDEASFTRDGINNTRNLHTWSHDNPHETRVTHFQRRFSVNVWCGELGTG